MKKLVFYMSNLLASATAVLMVIVFILLWQTSSVLVNLEGLTKVIEENLSNDELGLSAEIEDVKLSLGNIKNPIGIKAEKVKILYKNENIFIQKASAYFSLIGLFSGKFKTEKVLLEEVNLDLYQEASTNLNKENFKKWIIPKFVKDLILLNKQEIKSNNNIFQDFLKSEFIISESVINLRLNDEIEQLKNINFSIKNKPQDFNIVGDFIFSNVKEKILFSISQFNENLRLNFNFYEFPFNKIESLLINSNFNEEILISGNVNFEFDQKFNPNFLKGNLDLSNIESAKNNFFDIISEDPVRSGKLDLFYQFKSDQLQINNLLLSNIDNSIAEGSFQFSHLTEENSNLSFDLKLDQIGTQIFSQNILSNLAPLELSNGLFSDLHVKGNIILDNKTFDYQIEDLEVKGEIKKLKILSKVNSLKSFTKELNAQFVVNLGQEMILNKLNAHVQMNNFFLHKKGMKKELNFVKTDFDLSFIKDKILLSNLNSQTIDNKIFTGNAIVNLTRNSNIANIEVNLLSDRIDYNWLANIWPDGFGAKSRKWLKTKVQGGYGEEYNLNLGLNYNNQKFNVDRFNLEWMHKNSEISFYKGLPKAKVPEAKVSINQDEMRVNLQEFTISGILFNGGELQIAPVFNKGAKASMKLSGHSEASEILGFLNERDLDLLSKNKIGTLAKGKVSFNSVFKWPIKEKFPKKDFSWEIQAFGENIDLYSLPYNLKISDSKISVLSQNNYFQFSSVGKVNNIPSEIEISKSENYKPKASIKFPKSKELAKLISEFSKQDIAGKLGGLVEIESLELNSLFSTAMIELEDAHIKFPLLNYEKEKGVRGLIHCDLNYYGGELKSIPKIQGEIGSIAFDGNLNLFEGGINNAKFSYISYPGTSISKFELIKNKAADFTIEMAAEKINLNHLIKYMGENNSNPSELNLSFDLESGLFLLPGNLEMHGSILGNYNTTQKLSADVTGDIKVNDQISIEKTKVKAKMKNGQFIFKGSGKINQAHVTLDMKNSDSGKGKVLVIAGKNAGKILSGLDVTQLVEGGDVEININLDKNNFNNYDATIDISKFNVVNAPILVRLISTLSLTGLLNLLEEKGIYFERGVAKIKKINDTLEIEKIYAIGEAMAITLDGWINKNKDILQVHGTMAPATLLNKLLEPVPLLSELLIGGDKAGIVITEFRLDGSISKPMISFRPLSSAPGLLRDIFNVFRSDKKVLNNESFQN